MMTIGSLFAGIGGFDLGFERAGFEIRWQVEIDPFCRAVLAMHWPQVRRYEDIRTVVGAELEPVDVLCGGFPCQDISFAGRGGGIDGARSGLWGEFDRLIGLLRPAYVVVENVAALLTRGLGRVLGDLAARGYDAEWDCLPASAFGAPHRRDRLWLVAYPQRAERRPLAEVRQPVSHGNDAGRQEAAGGTGERREDVAYPDGRRQQSEWGGGVFDGERPAHRHDFDGCDSPLADTDEPRSQRRVFGGERPCQLPAWARSRADEDRWLAESGICRVSHGIPARVDRLKGLGNAVVPQITEWIARRIRDYEDRLT
jgi:DNA (cytosine-5)-methyltransferase 1